jgi:hypothetical protein
MDHELNRKFVADAFRLRHQGMRERRCLNRFRRGALLPQFATRVEGEDLLREGLDRVDRQNRRGHIVATIPGEHVWSFTGSHHEPFTTDTFKRRTE